MKKGIKRKIRVIVRPWTPRKIPQQIPAKRVDELIEKIYPKIKKLLYVGWVRRKIDGKRTLLFLAATGNTPSEARQAFKKSELWEEDIWIIN